MNAGQQVLVVQEWLAHYRAPFFDELRSRLAEHRVRLRVAHGQPGDDSGHELPGVLPWTEPCATRRLSVGGRIVVWQSLPRGTRPPDLVVVQQASRMLNTCALLAGQLTGGPRVALWGHGANLRRDGTIGSRLSEAAKRRYSRRAHWWFAYSPGSAARVAALGYPTSRITVVHNAVDTATLRDHADRVGGEEVAHAYAELGTVPTPGTCLYVGSLYREKRLDFLLAAGAALATSRPDFQLVVIGTGPQAAWLAEQARHRPWLHYAGPRYGREKAAYAAGARLLLMPGAVGLVVVDAFALGLPLVTTAVPYHSPEIEYLVDGRNGRILPAAATPSDYAGAVTGLLGDPARTRQLAAAARAAAAEFTVERMAGDFTSGVLAALDRGPAAPRRAG
jgi:glycosyltransferase involved in cell wall biosynthesis